MTKPVICVFDDPAAIGGLNALNAGDGPFAALLTIDAVLKLGFVLAPEVEAVLKPDGCVPTAL